jgi:alkyl sulfatase BDS1-like metallo-beta-lactamase superfamily hydrolase
MFKAERVAPGLYQYRGYEIENLAMLDSGRKGWNIRHLFSLHPQDSSDTLRGAKAIVDSYYVK